MIQSHIRASICSALNLNYEGVSGLKSSRALVEATTHITAFNNLHPPVIEKSLVVKLPDKWRCPFYFFNQKLRLLCCLKSMPQSWSSDWGPSSHFIWSFAPVWLNSKCSFKWGDLIGRAAFHNVIYMCVFANVILWFLKQQYVCLQCIHDLPYRVFKTEK